MSLALLRRLMKKKIALVLFWVLVASLSLAEAAEFVWEDVTVNLPETRLRDFAVAPGNPDLIFVVGEKGVWRTEDGGKGWREIFSVREKEFVIEERIKEKESRALFRFLEESDQDKVEFDRDFLAQVQSLILVEEVFSGGTVIQIDPVDAAKIYLGTFDGLYLSDDSGKTWRAVELGVGRDKNVILDICVSRHDPKTFYVGTLDGLFVSRDGGKKWKSLMSGIGLEGVSAILEDPKDSAQVWISVLGKGVFVTANKGKSWRPSSVGIGELSNQVSSLDLFEEDLFAATPVGLFCFKKGQNQWERCGVASPLGKGLKEIRVERAMANPKIFVSGKEGLFCSEDQGKTFEQISFGVRFHNADRIALNENQIYFLTPRGLFVANKRAVADSEEKNLLNNEETLWKTFEQEPSVQETQRQAMRFAQTEPEKVKAWYRSAKCRALLPKFQVGFDEQRVRQSDFASSLTRTFESSEELVLDEEAITTATFSGSRQVPTETTTSESNLEELSDLEEARFRERETEFVIGAVWELGDLIYSSDEITISKEARALAELRDDILKEVTQIYFRRRHLQFDQLLNQQEMQAPELDSKEKRSLQQKDWRMQLELAELTAQIDLLTGGWFSKELQTADKGQTSALPIKKFSSAYE